MTVRNRFRLFSQPPEKTPIFHRRSYLLALENFKQNKQIFSDFNVPLNGQRTHPVCDMQYGSKKLSWNGCELIAVCNVMNMCGFPQHFPQLILEFELNRMHYILPSGYFGTDPKRLKRYFKAHDVPFLAVRNPSDFKEKAAGGVYRCGIISFWNNKRSKHRLDFFSGGLHTTAYRYENGKYLVYNLFSDDTSPRVFDDISEVYKDRRFIIGYIS